jgi:hypothetical protein
LERSDSASARAACGRIGGYFSDAEAGAQ